ncbi:MAG: DUF2344 domain-containing protein, partial [Deltaproteobacteria bacterium]|nr:DUF2344 domain-containing protein [Deltaproteobacteria bacterium]
LMNRLKSTKLKPKWNPAATSWIEGILSRGDRRLGPVLRAVHARGGRFDGWTDRFRLDLWQGAVNEIGLNPADYLRSRQRDEVLPWDHLESGVTKEYLWSELEKARQAGITADCRSNPCHRCGVCDFKTIQPELCSKDQPESRIEIDQIPSGLYSTEKTVDSKSEEPASMSSEATLNNSIPSSVKDAPVTSRYHLTYVKDGSARLLSHLETVDVFLRAFRRAGLEFKMSQGFHPQPKATWATPLPVGLISRDEHLTVALMGVLDPVAVNQALAAQLPPGLTLSRVRFLPSVRRGVRAVGSKYSLEFDADLFSQETALRALEQDALLVEKKSKKGLISLNLISLIHDIQVLTPRTVEITLLAGPNGSIRPIQAVQAIFGLLPEHLETAQIIKLQTLLVDE